jgi:YVTN family beta-propeller protein
VHPRFLAFDPNSTKLYVTIIGSNEVAVIDTVTNTLLYTIPVEDEPEILAFNPSGTRLYVVNYGSNSVHVPGSISVIDPLTDTVVSVIPQDVNPDFLTFNPSGSVLYVPNVYSNNVSVIDTATNTVTATIIYHDRSTTLNFRRTGNSKSAATLTPVHTQ